MLWTFEEIKAAEAFAWNSGHATSCSHVFQPLSTASC